MPIEDGDMTWRTDPKYPPNRATRRSKVRKRCKRKRCSN